MSLWLCYIACVFWVAEIARSDDLACNHTGLGSYIPEERRLMACLLDGYDTAVRPAARPNDTVVVKFNMLLTNLRTVTWSDVQLQWNPEKFSGLTMMRIPVDRIWTPDIVLYNTATHGDYYITGTQAMVLSNGTVHWSPHGVFNSFCQPDFSYFPFDTQVCELLFGSWAYDKSRVDIQKASNESAQFLYQGSEWKMINFRSDRHELGYDAYQFPYIKLTLTIKRVSSFYKYMIVGPTIFTTALSLLVLLIPPSSGERFVMSSSVLISLTLMLILIGNYLPLDLGTVPLVAAYLSYNFILLAGVIVISTLALNFQNKDTRKGKVPSWVKWIFIFKVGPWLCVRRESYTPLATEVAIDDAMADRELEESLGTNTSSPLPRSPTLALEKTLDEIRQYLRILASNRGAGAQQSINELSHKQLVLNEWIHLALVIDRLAFWCLLITSAIVALALYVH
ncbi:hypothetical protein CAPTEDRAFT_199133 [Capitella teleta]|uniref:Neurotransmitter-gated ion-channel ligand-binding domain-containing protein n=1 Tax=Capitella teleta TaxID=283909 RepID=R7VE76_CAPTE|nr:hypothetical protein CAPTEDRAFT_199133 [Capitella teleta]|eukprot:ELU13980.1 hypothetical protein CAPTEDRAFT_199133 [Capitella teleta]